jgi:predicted TIM-barrel fold metal-dependent hydrolase
MIIDVYNHFIPQPIFERLGDLLPGHFVLKAFRQLPTLWDIEARLRLLDEFDDVRQVLSLANPPIELIGPPAGTPDIARMANDALADICRKHSDRFPVFVASLPMNNVEAALAEIDRAIGIGARGVQVFTNVAGEPLSAAKFRPVFQRMAQHDLPVWVHPMRSAQFADYANEKTSENEIWFSFGWPYETTACMTRLIYSGLLDELPSLKIISHHMGGMIPFFAGKIDLGFRQIFTGTPERNPAAEDAGLKQHPRKYYEMLYADTALNGEIAPTRCGHAFFKTAHCLFATDAPFCSEQGHGLIRKTIAAVNALEVSDAERERIFEGNARELMRL